jgi:hypothetical protein
MKVLRPVDDPVVQHQSFLRHDLDICVLHWHLLMNLLHRVKLPSVNFAAFEAIDLDLILLPHLLLSCEHLAVLKHVHVYALAFQVVHLEHCQIRAEVPLHDLSPVLLKHLVYTVQVRRRFHTPH